LEFCQRRRWSAGGGALAKGTSPPIPCGNNHDGVRLAKERERRHATPCAVRELFSKRVSKGVIDVGLVER
jgi:hypothetical protein